MIDKQKPILDKLLFEDVVFEDLDYDSNANFIIARVFEQGDVEDIRNCRRHYGDEKVTDALLNADSLSERRIYLASAVIARPLEDFKCYSPRKRDSHV